VIEKSTGREIISNCSQSIIRLETRFPQLVESSSCNIMNSFKNRTTTRREINKRTAQYDMDIDDAHHRVDASPGSATRGKQENCRGNEYKEDDHIGRKHEEIGIENK